MSIPAWQEGFAFHKNWRIKEMEKPGCFHCCAWVKERSEGLLLSVTSHQAKQFENRVMNYLVNNTGNYSGWWELVNKWWLWLYLKQIQPTSSFVHPPILFWGPPTQCVTSPLSRPPDPIWEVQGRMCDFRWANTVSLFSFICCHHWLVQNWTPDWLGECASEF